MIFSQGAIKIMTILQKNDLQIWRGFLPHPAAGGHKYDRGQLIVLGGVDMTGAARLAAEAGMRAGAGVCTVVSAMKTKEIYLKGAPHVMFEPYRKLADFSQHMTDTRRTAAVMGPGAGRDKALRRAVISTLQLNKPLVLDADALNVFEGRSEELFGALHERCVLTPHDGEFSRLFPDLKGERVERVVAGAKRAGCVLLLKGPETIIAAPDGRCVVSDHATPWLATAGAGDVLAGIIGGLLAQGMDSFLAACAGAWIHGDAAIRFGPGLTAPDIIAGIPAVLRDFA